MFPVPILATSLLCAISTVLAHPEHHHDLHPAELAARRLSANIRHVQARQCAGAIAQYTAERKAKRAMHRRQTSTGVPNSTSGAGSTSTLSGWNPTVTSITNNTCITAPEVTEGPYYIRNENVRQDIRDGERGINLTLDIGVMDTTTCTPLSGAFVELWHANATGVYGGFVQASTGGGAPGGQANGTMAGPPTGSPSGTPPSASGTAPAPSGTQGPGGSPGGGMSTAKTDDSTFLRGGWPTNTVGVVELLTVFPGFYSGRTAHIHLMVHLNYSVASNGTLVSDAGSLVHIGQLFFDQALSHQVFNTSVYLENKNQLTLNSQDSIFAQENADGNNAIIDISLLGGSLDDGLFGHITVGVNSSASYSIMTTNYHSGNSSLTVAPAAVPSSQNSTTSDALRLRGLLWL